MIGDLWLSVELVRFLWCSLSFRLLSYRRWYFGWVFCNRLDYKMDVVFDVHGILSQDLLSQVFKLEFGLMNHKGRSYSCFRIWIFVSRLYYFSMTKIKKIWIFFRQACKKLILSEVGIPTLRPIFCNISMDILLWRVRKKKWEWILVIGMNWRLCIYMM
jgi:hypothetical protein